MKLPKRASSLVPLFLAVVLLCPARAQGQTAGSLPGTTALTLEGDLAQRMLEGAHRFLNEKLKLAIEERKPLPEGRKFAEEARQRLGRILGTTDPRTQNAQTSLVRKIGAPSSRSKIAEADGYEALAVRRPVLDGVFAEGLLLSPVGRKPVANIIVLPDADQSPEAIAGLAQGVPSSGQFARRLVEAGCRVVTPVLIGRTIRPRSPRRPNVLLSDREFLHRSAFLMGRTLQGYEIQKALGFVDWFSELGDAPVGLVGYGEGGLLALRAAALDLRVEALLVSGSFGPRKNTWQEPLERNVFGLLPDFGDAELARMVSPRPLVVEATKAPEVKIEAPGSAPGKLTTPALSGVKREFTRAKIGLEGADFTLFSCGKNGAGIPGTSDALQTFLRKLSPKASIRKASKPTNPVSPPPGSQTRHERAFREIDAFTQKLLARSHLVRDAAFRPAFSSLSAYEKTTIPARLRFEEEIIGRFTNELLPPVPRSRKTRDRPKWTGHEVTLNVFPDLFAYGVLLVPKGIPPGERRPVVVCQHGLEGRPEDVFEGDHRAYHDFAAKLCEKGYIVFAPQNPYLMGDNFRSLQRKANPLGKTLFSLIVAQHRQIVAWLGSLPFADSRRIGFYGLSYGGKTAMRVPALVEGYALSICSADFNEWIRKTGSTLPGDDRYTYPFTSEYEIFEFDLGNTFNYAEMAALIAPRPFMVERGHFDGVAPDEWVAHEYAKVRRLYARLGLPERTEIEWFLGPHTINAKGAFRFLDKWLKGPKSN